MAVKKVQEKSPFDPENFVDFKLKKIEDMPSPDVVSVPLVDNDSLGYNQGFMLPNDGAAPDFFDRAQGASTPVPRSRPSRESAKTGKMDDSVVLRIDNVPWVSLFRMYAVCIG